MWILIIVTSIVSSGSGPKSTSPNVTAVEFSSKARCLQAAEMTLRQRDISNAFCVQK